MLAVGTIEESLQDYRRYGTDGRIDLASEAAGSRGILVQLRQTNQGPDVLGRDFTVEQETHDWQVK